MSPKKSTRSQAAQQLIENLLDELPPSKSPHHDQSHDDDHVVSMGEDDGSFGHVEPESNKNIVIEDDGDNAALSLEGSGKVHLEQQPTRIGDQPTRIGSAAPSQASGERTKTKLSQPPFDGDSPVVTQMAQRSKIVRPPAKDIVHEPRLRPEADVDFGDMSSDDPYDAKPNSFLNGDHSHDEDDQPVEELNAAATAPSTHRNPPPVEDERTMRVAAGTLVSPPEPRSEVIPISRSIDRGGATEIRAGVKIPPSPKFSSSGPGGAPTSIEATLKQSESLRIAQNRITDLEKELERVRRDNEALSTAGDTLRRRSDELAGKAESLEIQAREANIRLDEEKKVLRGQLQAKDRDNAEMKARVEEIETRLESNFKKIRVRERELEHRLEIVKMESATLVSGKDKMLLDLKRQIDQLHQESDSAKNKSQELFSQYKEKQDTIRRVVRALRIALTILEGDDETVVPIRKAE